MVSHTDQMLSVSSLAGVTNCSSFIFRREPHSESSGPLDLPSENTCSLSWVSLTSSLLFDTVWLHLSWFYSSEMHVRAITKNTVSPITILNNTVYVLTFINNRPKTCWLFPLYLCSGYGQVKKKVAGVVKKTYLISHAFKCYACLHSLLWLSLT